MMTDDPLAQPAQTPEAAAVTERALSAVEPFLAEVIAQLAPAAAGAQRGRPRILPSVCLWTGVVVCLLRGATTQNMVWRLLTRTRLWSYPRFNVTDQAVYRR